MAEHALSRVRSRGNPTSLPGYQGKRLTPLLAIQSFCRACMGGNALMVGACASTTCRFHAYRCGTIAAGADRRLLKIIKSHCAESCLPQEDAADCVAGGNYLGMVACPLWPYRQGRNPFFSEAARKQRRERALQSRFGQAQEPVSRPRIDESTPGHSSAHPVAQASLLALIPCPVATSTESTSTSKPKEVHHA